MLTETVPRSDGPATDAHTQPDFLDHLDDWLEYLTTLIDLTTDERTRAKYNRQVRYLLRFRCGANANIEHNKLLWHYYTTPAGDYVETIHLSGERPSDHQGMQQGFLPDGPVQECYFSDAYAFRQILKALATEELFFLQGPPGTGKTTAIVELVLQTLRHNPSARILITSETHMAVDNALDRLTMHLTEEQMAGVLRYPKFVAAELENPAATRVQAHARANGLWNQAHDAAPGLTMQLWQRMPRGFPTDDGGESLPRWMSYSLGDKHQIIGVTCNQIDHLLDDDSELFDLAIVDECSKATLPEWLMALTVARKCVLVGDHKQLPPTFCEDESQALSTLSRQQERLIRNGVIERIFEHLPESMKGRLNKQYRMLPHIGTFISELFYNGGLEHHRQQGNSPFEDFGWLTYERPGYRVPAQRDGTDKVLVNQLEVDIIRTRLREMHQQLRSSQAGRRFTVAVITPYRAQCQELRRTLRGGELDECFAIEIDTVDAFQGRQADIVFFSFVRTIGPATFYADDRRLNVAISRARDCVYLVGDIRYIGGKQIPALQKLVQLKVLRLHQPSDNRQAKLNASQHCRAVPGRRSR